MGERAAAVPALVRSARRFTGRRRRPDVRFLVLTPGRAGSILLLGMLASHPALVADFELLGSTPERPASRRGWERRTGPDAVLARAAAAAAATGARAWGFSLHPEHLQLQGVADPVAWCARFHDDGGRIVTLVRRNAVHHAVSALIATETGRWHAVADQRPDERVHLDPDVVLEAAYRAEESARTVPALVGDRSHLALTYEDALLDPSCHQGTVDRVLAFLGLDPAPAEAQLRRRPKPFRELVANYDEVARVLATAGRSGELADDG